VVPPLRLDVRRVRNRRLRARCVAAPRRRPAGHRTGRGRNGPHAGPGRAWPRNRPAVHDGHPLLALLDGRDHLHALSDRNRPGLGAATDGNARHRRARARNRCTARTRRPQPGRRHRNLELLADDATDPVRRGSHAARCGRRRRVGRSPAVHGTGRYPATRGPAARGRRSLLRSAGGEPDHRNSVPRRRRRASRDVRRRNRAYATGTASSETSDTLSP